MIFKKSVVFAGILAIGVFAASLGLGSKASASDITAPKASSVTSPNYVDGGNGTFDVYAYGVTDIISGVSRVEFSAWTSRNGQDDIRVYQGVNLGGGTWKCTIPISNHNNETGIYYINAYAADGAGNSGFIGATSSSVGDATAPNAPVITGVLNANGSVQVSINYSSDSVVRQYKIGSGSYQSYSGSFRVWNRETIYAKGQDASGNWSSEVSYVPNVDQTAPTGSITIDNGDEYTDIRDVNLSLYSNDESSEERQMKIWDANTNTGWIPYETSYDWLLQSGDGLKTIYVKYRDAVANESVVYSDTITLETDEDSSYDVAAPVGYININNGADSTSNNIVTLNISASDNSSGVKEMAIWDGGGSSGWITYQQSYIWTLSSGNGYKTVYIKFRDYAGNESATYSDAINLNSGVYTRPSMPSYNLSSNVYYAPQTLIITSSQGPIYYTLDGSEPTTSSSVYTYPIVINTTTTVKAKVYKDGLYSDTNEVRIVIGQTQVTTPTASIAPGIYTQYQYVYLYGESGATIRYTLDGSEPTEYSQAYYYPILVDKTMTIKAKAYRNGVSSQTLVAPYVINSTTDTSSLLSKARELYNQGRYSEAIDVLNKVLSIDKNNEDAAILLIDSYVKKGDTSGAKIRIQQISYILEYPRVVNRYAQLCIARGEYAEAREKILNILQRYPNEIYLYETLSKACKGLYINGIRVYVYGREVDFTKYDYIYPRIVNGRTLVPIRALSEALGAKVDWDYGLRKATIYLDNKKIELTDKSRYAKVNGVTKVLDVPAQIIGERLMIPLRFVSENFDKKVNWYEINSASSIISVMSN